MDFECEHYSAGTFADWRLPNIKELQSLIDFGQTNPALPPGHPFVDVLEEGSYWSSTTGVNRSNALLVRLDGGNTDGVLKSQTRRVWAVRQGK
jgi:Protein of unknown function (DUF1566)